MRRLHARAWTLALVGIALGIGACSSDDNSTNPADTAAPATVDDLAVNSVTASSAFLTWTAPGNDGSSGTAAQYDIRYYRSPITATSWDSATVVHDVPLPRAAGAAESMTVEGLHADTRYYFALRTADEVPNWSGISNVASATTEVSSDVIAPAMVTDLAATAVDSADVLLTWKAPGDDADIGTAHSYDVRYSRSVISDANWSAATQVSGEPAPAGAGTRQQMTIGDLMPNTQYYFALKTEDEVPNVSALSNVASARTPAGTGGPPTPLSVQFPDSICISSTDPNAVLARTIAQAQLSLAAAYSDLGALFFAPLQGADWQPGAGDCWTYDSNYSGCDATYESCLAGTEYTYVLTVDGTCGGHTYNNWEAYRALVDETARQGMFYAYAENTTTIQAAWTWTWAADENSGTYTFYTGDPASVPVDATLEWERSADGNTFDMTFEAPQDSRWVSHFVRNPCSGTVQTYQWDGLNNRFWLENDIAWNADGTGFYDVYDENGTLLEHNAW